MSEPVTGGVTPSSRVVTASGVRHIRLVHIGDLVLTHASRFRRVLKVIFAPFSGPTYRIEGRWTAAAGTRFLSQTGEGWQPIAWACAGHNIAGVHFEEWRDAVQRSERVGSTVPRGFVVNVPQGGVVIGISPERVLGKALFAARADSECCFMAEARVMDMVAVRLVVEEDESFVCERYAVRCAG